MVKKKSKRVKDAVRKRANSYTKYMKKEERRDFEVSLVLASVVMLVYFLIVGLNGFSYWIRYELVAIISGMFFIMPLFETVKRRYAYIDYISFSIGFIFFIIYVELSQWTFRETFIQYLQIFIVFIFLRPVLQIFYRKLKKEGLRAFI